MWTAEVANGEYDVHVVAGDPSAGQGPQRITAQGATTIADVATPANIFAEGTTRVSVRNGRLRVTIGGSSGTTTINYIEVTPVEARFAERGAHHARHVNLTLDVGVRHHEDHLAGGGRLGADTRIRINRKVRVHERI